MLYKCDYVKLHCRSEIVKGAKRPFGGVARSSLEKSKPECRYAAFKKINYLIINILKREDDNKKLTFLITV
jgi:hypothetical protein